MPALTQPSRPQRREKVAAFLRFLHLRRYPHRRAASGRRRNPPLFFAFSTSGDADGRTESLHRGPDGVRPPFQFRQGRAGRPPPGELPPLPLRRVLRRRRPGLHRRRRGPRRPDPPGVVPCVAVGVKSKLLLFSPQPGIYLEGKVAKVGREFVHAVVLGFASAAVSVEDVRGEFRYRDRNGDGVFASRVHRRHRIGAGSVVRFVVKSFDDDVLHISGSLMPGDTGCVRYLCKYGKEDDSGHGGDWSAMHENITDDGGNSEMMIKKHHQCMLAVVIMLVNLMHKGVEMVQNERGCISLKRRKTAG